MNFFCVQGMYMYLSHLEADIKATIPPFRMRT